MKYGNLQSFKKLKYITITQPNKRWSKYYEDETSNNVWRWVFKHFEYSGKNSKSNSINSLKPKQNMISQISISGKNLSNSK